MNSKIIGMVHLLPTIGHEGYASLDEIISHASKNINTLQSGGVDAIMIENNYDIPHTEFISEATKNQMIEVCSSARVLFDGKIGICCLWNDRKSALDIAKTTSLDFIRIPVFVDHIQTHYGFDIKIDTNKVIEYRKLIGAEHINLFVDIHVKHSTILSEFSLEESAKLAFQSGADGVIITGKWTGDLPIFDQIRSVRNVVSDRMVLVGSGVDNSTINSVLDAGADCCIVGTALKSNTMEKHHTNIRNQFELMDIEKVKQIVEKCV